MAKPSVFVRNATGLVRSASAFDAAIFNAAFSAPVGATLAFGVLWALGAFPGTNLVEATIGAALLSIPIIIMMALMASSMPRTGGDYVWVSRIMSPPLAIVSNFAAALSALIGAAYWARIFASLGVAPTLAILGHVLNSPGLTQAGNAIGGTGWTFVLGLFLIVILALSLTVGTKTMFRVQNITFIIAMAGTALSYLILAVSGPAQFVAAFNKFANGFTHSTNAYQSIIHTAGAAGLNAGNGNMFSATVPAIAVIMTFMMWNWWSVYLSGEMKGAANRRRQMGIMFTSLVWDAAFIILGILLLYHATGYKFQASVNYLYNDAASKYPLPVAPYFNLFASLLGGNSVLSIAIAATFLFWNLPAMVGNTFMPIRTLFAWSFDRVLPEKLSEVNDRTRTPIPAIITASILVGLILVWSTLSSSFFTLLSMGVLAGVVVIVVVGVAAILFPYRKRDTYLTSPANVSFLGVPVSVITGVLSILVMAFVSYLVLSYPALGIPSAWAGFAFVAGIVAFGLVVYYVSRTVRRSQGINLDLVYQELPPE